MVGQTCSWESGSYWWLRRSGHSRVNMFLLKFHILFSHSHTVSPEPPFQQHGRYSSGPGCVYQKSWKHTISFSAETHQAISHLLKSLVWTMHLDLLLKLKRERVGGKKFCHVTALRGNIFGIRKEFDVPNSRISEPWRCCCFTAIAMGTINFR